MIRHGYTQFQKKIYQDLNLNKYYNSIHRPQTYLSLSCYQYIFGSYRSSSGKSEVCLREEERGEYLWNKRLILQNQSYTAVMLQRIIWALVVSNTIYVYDQISKRNWLFLSEDSTDNY